MTPEQLIEAMSQTIKAQSDLISFLKAENCRLKLQTLPPLPPYQVPNNPLIPPYIITSSGIYTAENQLGNRASS